jgi:tRNA nucleotidyltransferase/poly(A) polymerase
MSDSIREAVFSWLKGQNVRAYWVGGSVRDWVSGRHVHDLDIAIEGRPIPLGRRLADAFGGAFYVLDVGREAVRVLLPTEAGQPFTLDLTRLYGGDIHSDLAARDFTINAMALPIGVTDLSKLVDPFGGLSDLRQGRLRPVSPLSLQNDPLRAFRAVRMAHQFALHVEPETGSLIRQVIPLLPQVSAERIRDEMCRILDLCPAGPPVADLHRLGLLHSLFERFVVSQQVAGRLPHPGELCALPIELQPHRAVEAFNAWESLFDSSTPPSSAELERALTALRDVVNRYRRSIQDRLGAAIAGYRTRATMLKWVILLLYTAGPMCVGALLGGLRFSNAEVRFSVTLANVFLEPMAWVEQQDVSPRVLHRFYRQARDCGPEALALFLADRLAAFGRGEAVHSPAEIAAVVDKAWRAYFEAYREIVAPPRLLNGEDIMAETGIPAGPAVRELLEQLQEAQAAGEIRSREEALNWLEGRAVRQHTP